jgi:arabinose-5-phosphate isomerase
VTNERASELSEVVRVLDLEGKAILACAEKLQAGDGAVIARAIAHLRNAVEHGGKIVVTGMGKSGKVAQKIAATLCSTGSLAVYLHPTEGLHGDLGLVTASDVVLALSYSGNTEDIVRLLPSLKQLKVPLIAIGGNAQSKLAVECDVWIDAAVEHEACPHNLAPTTSTTLALAIGDALAIALMRQRGFGAVSFARIHPGGSLGKRMTLTVADLMHQGDAIGVVPPTASMNDVVVLSTQKKLGAVLVAEAGKLAGIITDGDLRRALQHGEKFFRLSAADVMTRKPTTAQPEMLAARALELMENRPSQISVLPVVDAEGGVRGLLRLHDLVRAF